VEWKAWDKKSILLSPFSISVVHLPLPLFLLFSKRSHFYPHKKEKRKKKKEALL
jgi:hypothetical protein